MSVINIIFIIFVVIFAIVFTNHLHLDLAVMIIGRAGREATGAAGKLVEATTVTASFELTWW